jgi:hypothetical protein
LHMIPTRYITRKTYPIIEPMSMPPSSWIEYF